MFNLTIEAKDEGQPTRANTVSNNSLLSEFASPFMFEHKKENSFESAFFFLRKYVQIIIKQTASVVFQFKAFSDLFSLESFASLIYELACSLGRWSGY